MASPVLLGFSVQWEEHAEEGLFRYDVTACETKVSASRQLCTGLHFCPAAPCSPAAAPFSSSSTSPISNFFSSLSC